METVAPRQDESIPIIATYKIRKPRRFWFGIHLRLNRHFSASPSSLALKFLLRFEIRKIHCNLYHILRTQCQKVLKKQQLPSYTPSESATPRQDNLHSELATSKFGKTRQIQVRIYLRPNRPTSTGPGSLVSKYTLVWKNRKIDLQLYGTLRTQ